jgi:hypothetical protein
VIPLGLIERIKKILIPEKKTYVLKVTPELLRKIPALLKKELGMKDSIILKQKEEIEGLKREIEKLKGKETEEEKIVKELLAEKEKMKKIKERRRIRKMFSGVKLPKLLTWDKKFFHDGKIEYRLLKGLEDEEKEERTTCNLLVVPDEKFKSFGRIETGLPFELLVEDPTSFVSDVRAGVVRIRIDSKGVWHPPEEIASNPGSYKDIAELRKKYEQKIAELKEEISKVYSEMEDTKKREEKTLLRLKDAEVAASINDYRADQSEAFALSAISKMKGFMRDTLQALSSSQEAEVGRVLTDRLNDTLIEANSKMRERLGMEIPEDVRDLIRERVKLEFMDALDVLYGLSPRRVEVERKEIPATKPPEKPPEKAGE